jgi:hypothetical protein
MVSPIPNSKILDKEEGKILKLAHSFFHNLNWKIHSNWPKNSGFEIRNSENRMVISTNYVLEIAFSYL